MKKHLAIMHKSAIEAILAGKKTIETRFSKHKIPPFGVVNPGDIIYMKPPGEEISGQFRVKKVFFFAGLLPADVQKIFQEYGKQISVGNSEEDQNFQKEKQTAAFASLIFVAESERFITSPIKFKKKDLRGWVVLE